MTSQSRPREFLKFGIPGIQEFLFHCTFNIDDDHDLTLAFRLVTAGVYVLSCRLTFGPLGLRIFLLLLWFLSVLFGLFLLYWTFELPCHVKLPEIHDIPI